MSEDTSEGFADQPREEETIGIAFAEALVDGLDRHRKNIVEAQQKVADAQAEVVKAVERYEKARLFMSRVIAGIPKTKLADAERVSGDGR